MSDGVFHRVLCFVCIHAYNCSRNQIIYLCSILKEISGEIYMEASTLLREHDEQEINKFSIKCHSNAGVYQGKERIR